jgi:hypothetical protein
MSWKRLSSKPMIQNRGAARATLAAALFISLFVASEARAICPQVDWAGHFQSRSSHHLTDHEMISDRAKVPSSYQATRGTSVASVNGRVRFEFDFCRTLLRFNTAGSISYHQFVVVWRDSVESLVVLPGTPPPTFLA